MELTFPHGVTADADDFWTAARSGEFRAEDLAEAGEIVTGLQLGRPIPPRWGNGYPADHRRWHDTGLSCGFYPTTAKKSE
ncbi:hypothetical protein ABTX15_30950 [Micromonospora sp. NPDC094482]